MNLTLGLIHLIISTLFGKWTDEVGGGKVSPIYVSFSFFSFGLLTFWLCLKSAVPATKIFSCAVGCHFFWIGTVYMIKNDHKTYHEDAVVWIAFMTLLMSLTGILLLFMDYSNTKWTLTPFLLAFLGSLIRSWQKVWRSRKD